MAESGFVADRRQRKKYKFAQSAVIVRAAERRIARHSHFAPHPHAVNVSYESGRLILTGRLPSFYLKQVLQKLLEDLPGVTEIDNQTDVICSCGLSSTACEHAALDESQPCKEYRYDRPSS
jgi:hypothetical protein